MRRRTLLTVLLFIASVHLSRAQMATFDQPFTETVVCHGKTVQLPFSVTGIFQPGNVFTAQLSDVTGNFINAVDIGSVAATTSGIITVTFPFTVSVGTGYRIRLTSSSPVLLFPDNGVDIKIENAPTPPVISNNSPVCEHDTLLVKVTNAGSIQTDSIVWSGGILSAPGPLGAALSTNDASLGYSGTYTIVRYGKFSKCPSPSVTALVWVQPLPPSPVASANPQLVCEGEAVQLNATTSPAAPAYAWTGPGSFSSTAQAPYISAIVPAGEGWYKAYSVLNGCYSGKPDSVWIDVIPAPKLQFLTNSPLCEGGNLQASAFDTGNISYTWKGPNGFQASDSVIRIINAPVSASGTYFVYTVRNSCTAIDSIQLRVKPYPYPAILNSNSPVCEGDSLFINTVQISQPGIVSYNFFGPDGTSLGAVPPVLRGVTKDATGLYSLVTDIEGCSRKDSVYVTVKPTPVITTNKEFMMTVQQPVQLLANSNIPGTTFYWQGPNGFTSTEQNPVLPSITERNKGTYTVRGSFDGCFADTSTEVGVWYLTDYTLFKIHPNPNDGRFTLIGRVKKAQVVDVAIFQAGSSIALYKDKIPSNGKLVDATITLYDHLAPGEYILKVRADGEAIGLKFSIMH